MTDPTEALDSLGAVWSPNFDDFAAGRIDASQVRCLMCDGPCTGDHPALGSPEYMAVMDRIHGR